MTRGVPDTSRSVSRENRTITRNIPSIYRKQSTSIRHGPQAGNTHITDAAQAGISPFDVLSAGMLEWWNIYIAGPWNRRKTEKEIEDFATILEGFQRIILGEKFVAEEVIGGVTYEEGSIVPKPSPETFTEDTLNAINTEPRTWQDLIQEILAILPEEFWVGLDYFANAVHTLIDNLSNTIATAAGRIERGDGDWGNSAQRFFFGEKTTQAISYGMDDTAGSFASGTLLDWVLTEPERSELTSDNTVARDFFEFLTSIGLDALGKFLKPIWEAIKDFGDSVISGIANAIASIGAWWESLGEGVADAIKLVGEWWEGLDQTIRDGIKTAVEWVTDAVGKIREILEDLSKGFWKGVDNFTDAVEETVEDVWTWLNDVGAEIQKTLNSWGSTVWTNLTNFGNAAKAAIDRAYTWLSDATEATIKWLSGLGSTIRSSIVSAGNYLTSTIRRGISSAVSWVGSAINNILSAIQNHTGAVWSYIEDNARRAFDSVYATLSGLGDAISAALGTAWDSLNTWWTGFGSPFSRGSDQVDGINRMLFGEIFTSSGNGFSTGSRVTSSTLEHATPDNTIARGFQQWFQSSIDDIGRSSSTVLENFWNSFTELGRVISESLFGNGIFPVAYGDSLHTPTESPTEFIEKEADERAQHWFYELLRRLTPNPTDPSNNPIVVTSPFLTIINAIVSFFGGGGGTTPSGMFANTSLSNLGDTLINKTLNWARGDTGGTQNSRSIGFVGRLSGLPSPNNITYDMYLKTPVLGKLFFQPGGNTLELSPQSIRFQTASTGDPALGEIKQVNDNGGLTLKAEVYRNGTRTVVDFADIGTGGGDSGTTTDKPPSWSSTPNSNFVELQRPNDFDFTFQATDEDNSDDDIRYSMERGGAAAGTRFGGIQSVSGVFRFGTTNSTPTGDYVFTIKATSNKLSITYTITFRVSAVVVNTAPRITAPAHDFLIKVTKGTSVNQQITAVDDQADNLTWSERFTRGRTGITASINSSGVLRASAASISSTSVATVRVTVSDGSLSDNRDFKIQAVDVPVTDFSINNIPSQIVTAGSTTSITATTSPAQSGLSWAKESGPSFVTIDSGTGEIEFDPDNDDIRSSAYAVEISATKSGVTKTESFNVTVQAAVIGQTLKIPSKRVTTDASSTLRTQTGRELGSITLVGVGDNPSKEKVYLVYQAFSDVAWLKSSRKHTGTSSGGTGAITRNTTLLTFTDNGTSIRTTTNIPGNKRDFFIHNQSSSHAAATAIVVANATLSWKYKFGSRIDDRDADASQGYDISTIPFTNLSSRQISASALDRAFGSDNGNIGFNEADDNIYGKFRGHWYGFGLDRSKS